MDRQSDMECWRFILRCVRQDNGEKEADSVVKRIVAIAYTASHEEKVMV
jgi:hypothetical protein